jgi:hypothetical protein
VKQIEHVLKHAQLVLRLHEGDEADREGVYDIKNRKKGGDD